VKELRFFRESFKNLLSRKTREKTGVFSRLVKKPGDLYQSITEKQGFFHESLKNLLSRETREKTLVFSRLVKEPVFFPDLAVE
jgi:hypothetical protein